MPTIDRLCAKTMLLDLDGTLLDFSIAERSAFNSMLFIKGHPDLEGLRQIYQQSNKEAWRLYEAGMLSISALASHRFKAVADLVGDVSPDELGKEFLQAMSQQSQIFHDSLELVQRLQNKYSLSIATNGFSRVQTARIRNSPLNKYINKIFVSEAMTSPKPSYIFFKSIASELACNISDLILIGDSLYSDVIGPAEHGVKTIHLCRQSNKCEETNHVCFKSVHEIINFLGA